MQIIVKQYEQLFKHKYLLFYIMDNFYIRTLQVLNNGIKTMTMNLTLIQIWGVLSLHIAFLQNLKNYIKYIKIVQKFNQMLKIQKFYHTMFREYVCKFHYNHRDLFTYLFQNHSYLRLTRKKMKKKQTMQLKHE